MHTDMCVICDILLLRKCDMITAERLHAGHAEPFLHIGAGKRDDTMQRHILRRRINLHLRFAQRLMFLFEMGRVCVRCCAIVAQFVCDLWTRYANVIVANEYVVDSARKSADH